MVEIDASWGLGEMVVQGKVTPDAYLVFKPTLNQGFPAIIKKSLGSKENKMIYNSSDENQTKEVEVSEKDRNIFVLNDEEILTLAKWGLEIENIIQKELVKPCLWIWNGLKTELQTNYLLFKRDPKQFSQKKA